MKPAPVQKSASVAIFDLFFLFFQWKRKKNHSCTAVILLCFSLFITNKSFSQDSTKTELTTAGSPVKKISDSTTFIHSLTKEQIRKRTRLVIAGNVIGYGAAMAGFYSAWYKNYPQSKFHVFNDYAEWKQMDKVGHLYGAYIESRGSMELWRWTGIDRKKRIWIGGMSGAFYQTVIETLDGFSAQWGWSWSDFATNILGSGMLVAQELAWDDQRIKLKFSFHKKKYRDAALTQRTNVLFGEKATESFIKDYNGQTYWASANLKSFFPKSNLPPWLCLSVGYGAEGLFGARENFAKDKDGNITFDRKDITRHRQWYIAPDIDLSKIKTNSKALKFFFTFLSAFKFPAPALELNAHGKSKFYFLYF